MSEKVEDDDNRLNLKIPLIKAESETQTIGHLVHKSSETNAADMENIQPKSMSIQKRRNLSKTRGAATRNREKTPEPGRSFLPDDTNTSEDDEPVRNSREIEADSMYEEMKRLVSEQSGAKDPIYDLDRDEVLEARAMAANERRRRSISPFAIPDKEELCKLERNGSFMDPTNKLLSTTYTLSPKDEDTGRRSSLTIEYTNAQRKNSLTPPATASPKDKDFPYQIPSTPRKLEEMVYQDEVLDPHLEEKIKKPRTPIAKENIFSFEQKDIKPNTKHIDSKHSLKTPEATTPASPGEIVTKIIEIERSPSKKLSQDTKPVVQLRERIVRTPSKKLMPEVKPTVLKQPAKLVKDETSAKVPPVKPARSKSATRFGNKTSESEDQMSEDQVFNLNLSKRKITPTPRRFLRKKSPRANRSQSVQRVEDLKVVDKTGTGMSQTSREIIELMQKARARSLSIPKDDPKIPVEYKKYNKKLQTPNKSPTSRRTRGISCPKTIQIISDKEILSGLAKPNTKESNYVNTSRQSSGYIDASQSEYTSSCYSSSPSENEYEFDLAEKTVELTRKLHLLSQEKEMKEDSLNILLSKTESTDKKSGLRKRRVSESKSSKNTQNKDINTNLNENLKDNDVKKVYTPKIKIIANWRQFKIEQKESYAKIISLVKKCICDLILLILMCGLGGMMFRSLEGSLENNFKCSTRNVKRDFLESLWRGSHYLREDDWKSMARKKLFEFESQLHTAYEAGVTSYSGQKSWNFMNSFVYCFTLITTIGYGHIAPKTTSGRVATIVYAIIGIPLFLIVLADFGKLFTRIIKFFWSFIRRFYYTRSCRKVRKTGTVQEVMKGLNIVYDAVRRPSQIFTEEDFEETRDKPPTLQRKPSDAPPPLPPKPIVNVEFENDIEPPETPAPSVFEIDDEFNLPISLAIFILVVYIIIGATAYNLWEEWDFFESFYFVFISMSTIGLGDLVPDHPMFMMASILYLVFGLALTSMCINVVQEKLSDTFKQASAKLGATIGLKVAEEDGSLVPISPIPTEIVPVHKPRDEPKNSLQVDNSVGNR